ncbi:MAG: OmpA family protein [Alphaproteobacteria bacterium]|nr:OmpA family protein [Alphaproteobacteria bacterium]MBN2675021.1 OmpA family protein [Alphaproteobacteria bacterium]
MKNKSYTLTSLPRFLAMMSILFLAACAGLNNNGNNTQGGMIATPTVDYVESLDVYSAPHQDSFLNQLAMNYRSYAIYNARTSGHFDMGEIFAQKAVTAFSGELPFPESLDNWVINDENQSFEFHNAYNRLLDQLKNDASDTNPDVAAEAQAKFDCWLSASASGQNGTAQECQDRFEKAMAALDCGGKTLSLNTTEKNTSTIVETKKMVKESYYPETSRMSAMNGTGHARDGVIIVNNVNIPEHLINPVPVQPMVFNQNIYSNDRVDGNTASEESDIPMIGEEMVSREEFINMMMAMRSELTAINARLDKIQESAGEKTILKVQQIPLEPKQHVMEEIFEIRFDFNKSTIKPEYQDLIRKLATATQENKNIKVSVIGHTDTAGSSSYNYALGGRRAEAVQKMLVKYGIPSSQIVAVSSGEKDNKVPTGDGVPNSENRRVRVVKEVHYTEPQKSVPVAAVEVEKQQRIYFDESCGMYGCDK